MPIIKKKGIILTTIGTIVLLMVVLDFANMIRFYRISQLSPYSIAVDFFYGCFGTAQIIGGLDLIKRKPLDFRYAYFINVAVVLNPIALIWITGRLISLMALVLALLAWLYLSYEFKK